MWPRLVVVLSPQLNRFSSFLQRLKPALIQTAVSELSIEAFHKNILGRLTWLHKIQSHPAVTTRKEHRFGGELRTVVTNQRPRISSGLDRTGKVPGNPFSAYRKVYGLANSFSAVFINDIQYSKSSATS